MIATLPTGRQGRILALGLALVVLAALYSLVAVPLLELYARNAALAETRRALVERLGAIARELPALRAQVAELREAGDNQKMTLVGDTDAVASAALQGRIEEFAAAAGVTIGSTESLPTEVLEGFHRLGLRLVVNGSYEALVKLLARLETAATPLVVDNLQIHAFQRRPSSVRAPMLDASLEVYGFRVDEKTDSAAPR